MSVLAELVLRHRFNPELYDVWDDIVPNAAEVGPTSRA
jgi:hypothetical protein